MGKKRSVVFVLGTTLGQHWGQSIVSLTAMLLLAFTSAALAGAGGSHGAPEPAAALVETVRHATQRFQNVEEATAAGYANTLFCVSGPEAGAMGIHFVNGDLIGDGALDPQRPEALIYEAKNDTVVKILHHVYPLRALCNAWVV